MLPNSNKESVGTSPQESCRTADVFILNNKRRNVLTEFWWLPNGIKESIVYKLIVPYGGSIDFPWYGVVENFYFYNGRADKNSIV